ncbi:hypothetical protein Patl1_33530 [Pistacia atlantica]|uniref:Uncharacterized protein n=1 Tax=Pistacia atlantica TaxID=434234 RepID=A0ACC0ZTJ5_9ROSI|nr:hypothetical protein Patl1_33530 [Pistacia atlantica]
MLACEAFLRSLAKDAKKYSCTDLPLSVVMHLSAPGYIDWHGFPHWIRDHKLWFSVNHKPCSSCTVSLVPDPLAFPLFLLVMIAVMNMVPRLPILVAQLLTLQIMRVYLRNSYGSNGYSIVGIFTCWQIFSGSASLKQYPRMEAVGKFVQKVCPRNIYNVPENEKRDEGFVFNDEPYQQYEKKSVRKKNKTDKSYDGSNNGVSRDNDDSSEKDSSDGEDFIDGGDDTILDYCDHNNDEQDDMVRMKMKKMMMMTRMMVSFNIVHLIVWVLPYRLVGVNLIV